MIMNPWNIKGGGPGTLSWNGSVESRDCGVGAYF